MTPITTKTLKTTAQDHRIAWLAALAITIHLAESALPSPLPGLKPGLANVITLAALIEFGWQTALWISLLRVLVGSLLLGTFLSPTFVLSLSGAVASMAALGIVHGINQWGSRYTNKPLLGPVGYAIPAALAHMAGQFSIAYHLFVPHEAIWQLFPILLTAALIFGVTSGYLAQMMLTESRRSSLCR